MAGAVKHLRLVPSQRSADMSATSQTAATSPTITRLTVLPTIDEAPATLIWLVDYPDGTSALIVADNLNGAFADRISLAGCSQETLTALRARGGAR